MPADVVNLPELAIDELEDSPNGAALRSISLHFGMEGAQALIAFPPTTRWAKPINAEDSLSGGFTAYTPGVWFPGRYLAEGADGQMYGTPFLPKRPDKEEDIIE